MLRRFNLQRLRRLVASRRGWSRRRALEALSVRLRCPLRVGDRGHRVVSSCLLYGTEYSEARAALEGSGSLPWWYALAKMASTTLAAIIGIPGGVFSPSLSVGAGLGIALAYFTPTASLRAVVPLDMAGYFAGVAQAPITAFVIVMEMTNNHTMILPLMTASLIGYGISRLICRERIYHALSRQFLSIARAQSD